MIDTVLARYSLASEISSFEFINDEKVFCSIFKESSHSWLLISDHDLVQLVRQIEARDESRKLSSRNIRKELHTLNRDIIRQSKPDPEQRTKMLDLMKKLNYTKEDEPEMRLAKAKHFMEEREGQGSTNLLGLYWFKARYSLELG